ncbi:HET-domain-containing protein, partial [Polychaeton citri CBS 116435]
MRVGGELWMVFETPNSQTTYCCLRHSTSHRQHWNYKRDLDSFDKYRWHFLVLEFDHNIFQYEISHNQLLPFIEEVHLAGSSHGNFSEVTCVEMLARKQTKVTSANKTITVALKTLKNIGESRYDIDKEWRREAKAHKQLNGRRNHIVEGLAAFRQTSGYKKNDKYYFVFEWADGGNLLSFWKENPGPQIGSDIGRSRERVMSVLTQLRGLADALEGMHTTPARSPGHSKCNTIRLPELFAQHDVLKATNDRQLPSISATGLPLPAFNFEGSDGLQDKEKGAPGFTISTPDFSEQTSADAECLVRRGSHLNSVNWRHGDIKPENILRFKEGVSDAWIGTLKLADLGRAQEHFLKTLMRGTQEQEPWRTRWYEPPDLAEDLNERAGGKISRLFDIWSMGCIIFETALWLLYGVDSVTDFFEENSLKPNELNATPYWRKTSHGGYEISGAASRWMNHILQHDPERNSAIGHMVKLVKDRLLKIALPPDSEAFLEGFRTNAADLKDQLDKIIEHATKDERCLFTGIERSNIVTPQMSGPTKRQTPQSESGSRLTPNDAGTEVVKDRSLENVPLGAPILSPIVTENPFAVHLKLPRAWLQECDSNHFSDCSPRDANLQLPKRLIKVDHPKKPRIIESEELSMDPQKVSYIAFSHKWGNMPPTAKTTRQNLEQRRKRIPPDEIPKSFRDAIAVTRALDHNYLWIDTLCISQGPDGDFIEQADTMQTTFSGAHCVIAACSAENATDGFLQNRETGCVKIGGVFVSTVTNDFERDVLQSGLNQRGWVLQEHALAQRTIFFTKNQMYWECGHGAAFLGDPNFPNYTIRPGSTRGEQIHLFTNLFQQCSKLEFSHPEDRPIAIDGLMDRLTSAFKTRSLAGVFESFWGRCLLWQRVDRDKPLGKIPLGSQTRRTPPSWSWMAVEGAISFLEPKGGEVEWNHEKVQLPFGRRTQSSWLKTSHMRDNNAIQAHAYEFTHSKAPAVEEAYLSYDSGRDSSVSTTKCVIIGSEKERVKDPEMRKHYVLLVSRIMQNGGADSYQRVGVGHLPEKLVKL